MKKLSIVLTLVLIFSVTLGVQAALIDGTYEAWSDASPNGTQSAKVFIEDGKIVAVVLREFTDKHVEKDFSIYPWPEAGQAARSLGAQFVANQAAEADIVTGATHSVEGWIQAVDRALVKASDQKPNQKYFDGTFLGRSEVSSYGEYYKVVWVTLKNDKIVDYSVQRVLPDHTIQDPSFEVYGWPLEMARESYKDAAIESTPGYVDIISGATGLVIQSNHAVRDALDKALIAK
ncbi:MAG: FMN-binding protein [Bacillota bacterium]|nr:FMN-binding protein [Bacillota bacterium]HHU60398.1 FMN-binding protein [Natronincola sp.]